MRYLGRTLLATVIVLGVSGCGESGAGPTSKATTVPSTSPSFPDTAPVVTDPRPSATGVGLVIVENLGPAEALPAVLLALDAGYITPQIARGAGDLEATGRIGSTSPVEAPTGLFTALAAVDPEAVANAVTVDEASEHLRGRINGGNLVDMAERLVHRDLAGGAGSSAEQVAELDEPAKREFLSIVLILVLADVGYSADQIIEGLILGTAQGAPAEAFEEYCVVLVDEAGSVISPRGTARIEFERSPPCSRGLREGSIAVESGFA